MFNYFKKNKGLSVLTIIFSIISSISFVYVAVLLQRILDAAIQQDMDSFTRILGISVVYFIVMGFLVYGFTYCEKKLICKILQRIRKDVFAGIIEHSYEDFNKLNTGDYLSSLTNDIKLIEDNYFVALMDIIQYSIIFITSLILMIQYDIIVTISVLVCIMLMFIIPSLFGKALEKRQENYSNQLSQFTKVLKDLLSGFEVVQAYQMKKYVNDKFHSKNTNLASSKLSVDRLMASNEAVSTFLSVMIQIVVLFLSAYFIIIGRMSVGVLMAMVQMSGNLANPLLMIFSNLPKLSGVKPIIEKVNEFINYKNEDNIEKLISFEKKIVVENLKFSYDHKTVIINNVSFSLDKGKKYAIVGPSGSGKTTLIKLLTGYHKDYQGHIQYDDTVIENGYYQGVTKLSSIIHQNIYMFNETILDNISLHQSYDDNQIKQAIEISGVDQFLDNTPQGLLSSVGENGGHLSGGQKQRIAVARAIICNRPLLILDEGTSAIDMQVAYDIESRLLDIDNLTLLTITHNMNEEFLKHYDEIIFMENGEIIEKATLQELLIKKGAFYNFFTVKKK
ncbi:MAG: ABC transporter ATP-binding protein [Coprobacillus sp.]